MRPSIAQRDATYRRMSIATAAGGVVMVAFWTLYLTANDVIGLVDRAHISFENAFIVADSILAALLLVTSAALRHRRRSAPFLLAMAASMTLYLGLLDATFYGRSGAFYPLTGNGVMELAIVLACVAGGLYGLRSAWTIWSAAEPPAARSTVTPHLPSTDDDHPQLRIIA